MAKLFGRLNNLSYRGGETGTANVVIDGGVITVDVKGSPQDVTGASIIDNKVHITRANASPLEMALPLPQPDLAETNTESLAFVKNKKISYLENDKDYITTSGANKAYIKKVTVNNVEVPILDNDIEQVAQLLVGEGLSVGVNATVSVDTSKIATNEYVDSNTAVVTENITQHKNDYNNPHKVTKAQVGLDKVDNTADIDKPISTATKTALDTLQSGIEAHIEDGNNPHQVTAEQIGLGNVDNTSDMDKPVSTLQQEALDTKLDKSVVAVPSTANTVAKRHADGKLYVGTPTENYDAATKKYVDDIAKDKLDKAGGSITGDLAVQGDLTVSGTTTSESQKQLLVEDNVIVTNANKIDLQSLLSGIAINKNPDATYGIMYDPSDDTVKFGAGTLDENNKFTFNEGEGLPIAIRAQASDFTDAHLVKWDATKNAFVDAGYTGDDIASKTNVTVNGEHVDTFNADTKVNHIDNRSGVYKVYLVSPDNNDEAANIAPTTAVISNGSVAGYRTDVAINDTAPTQKVYLVSQTPVRNYHVATKKYVDDQVSTKTSVTVGGANVATFDADTKLDKVSGSDNAYKIYGTDNNGNNIRWNLTYFPQVGGGTIPVFNSNRTITVDPAYNFSALQDSDAINKKYVDNTISSATSITILEASDA